MSDPTYRIDVERLADGGPFRWVSCVMDVIGGRIVGCKVGITRSGSLRRARRLVRAQARHADYPAKEVLYVDDDGRSVEGHSVKA